jgi:hypothetical protein
MTSTIIGNLIVETQVRELPSGQWTVQLGVRRLVETGQPLSEEEQETLRHVMARVGEVAGAEGLAKPVWEGRGAGSGRRRSGPRRLTRG